MIFLNRYPIKIFTKDKNNNLYVYNFEKPYKGVTTKIIIKKNKLLCLHDDEEDYWQFLVNKIIKLSEDWRKLNEYMKKYKFEYCKKVKIYSNTNKLNLKVKLYKSEICFIYHDKMYYPIDLKKIRENIKIYRKFENRYYYSKNYDYPETEKYADYYNANLWFKWFYLTYPEYHLPMEERRRNDIVLGLCDVKNNNINEEPSIDYELID